MFLITNKLDLKE